MSEAREKATSVSEGEPEESGPVQGKGRPTPSRKEAEAARKARAKAAADPKQARKAERAKARSAQAKAREAMLAGEEKYLPRRDQGPVRRYTRDWVDSRFSMGEFFLPAAIAVILLGLIPNPALRVLTVNGWLLLTLLVIVDSSVLAFRLRSDLKRRWPEKADRKGATTYAILRGLQMRSLRVPKPQVKRGQRPD